jgi:hypothetical protein
MWGRTAHAVYFPSTAPASCHRWQRKIFDCYAAGMRSWSWIALRERQRGFARTRFLNFTDTRSHSRRLRSVKLAVQVLCTTRRATAPRVRRTAPFAVTSAWVIVNRSQRELRVFHALRGALRQARANSARYSIRGAGFLLSSGLSAMGEQRLTAGRAALDGRSLEALWLRARGVWLARHWQNPRGAGAQFPTHVG